MTSGKKPKVLVIGAGVIGLTTASELSSWCDVDVVAEKIGVQSDSWKATAIWHVYLVPETKQVLEWAAQTLEKLVDISRAHPRSGIELVSGVELFRKGRAEVPSWAHIPPEFVILTDAEVARYNEIPDGVDGDNRQALKKAPVKWGYRISAPAVSMLRYLPWLQEQVVGAGVNIRQERLAAFPADASYDAIVNCTGYGSRQLALDPSFEIYRGQYFVLHRDAECPAFYIGDDDHPGGMAYAIPRGDEVVVGGCAEKDELDLELTITWEDVVSRASLYFPWLREKTGNDFAMPPVVCLRPARIGGIRLEREARTGTSPPIIHNYGHGGSGFSLSWGCAATVAALVKEIA